ncbi:hypothetical protein HN363_03050 [Candidatus Woesearchaeota archaeon]|nr:hypothetical protein [Candidatus Woesearchaeota archaeon]
MTQLGSKGQSEIVGLMVIVVILILMGMFYLGFSNIADSKSSVGERRGLEAENALKSVMQLDLEGLGNIEGLVVECGNGNCSGLESALIEVYSVVLRPGESYKFSAYIDGVKIYEYGTCNLGLVSSYPFPKNGLFYEVKFKLCG